MHIPVPPYAHTLPPCSQQNCVSFCPSIGEFPEFGIYSDATDMGAVTIEGKSYEDWQVRVCVCVCVHV
jgi:hypothetical protein